MKNLEKTLPSKKSEKYPYSFIAKETSSKRNESINGLLHILCSAHIQKNDTDNSALVKKKHLQIMVRPDISTSTKVPHELLPRGALQINRIDTAVEDWELVMPLNFKTECQLLYP